MIPSTRHSHHLARFIAFCVAVAIPLRASGVATQQAALGLALLGSFIFFATNANVRKFIRQAVLSTPGKMIIGIMAAWAVTIPFSDSPLGSLNRQSHSNVCGCGYVGVGRTTQ
ncbi:MAG: hypothetical protein JKY27_09780 [Magnetovibrio sp.]|nr:hypothetical protein [Magnetovibrio sp.]